MLDSFFLTICTQAQYTSQRQKEIGWLHSAVLHAVESERSPCLETVRFA